MRNWPQTVISQFADSPRMLALLESIDEWISPDANLENFFQFVWNIRRQGGAFGHGLDVWGRIVNVGRVVSLTTFGPSFGFGEAGDRTGFDQANFYSAERVTTNFTLTDEVYRLLIFARAALNLTDCSIPAINAILMNLFPDRGNAYVTDGRNGPTNVWFGFGEAQDRVPFSGVFIPPGDYFGFGEPADRFGFDLAPFYESGTTDISFGPFQDFGPTVPKNMSMIYVFEFVLHPFEIAIVTNSGVLPKPVGVRATASYLT